MLEPRGSGAGAGEDQAQTSRSASQAPLVGPDQAHKSRDQVGDPLKHAPCTWLHAEGMLGYQGHRDGTET